jgi:hypothetical protein
LFGSTLRFDSQPQVQRAVKRHAVKVFMVVVPF